MTERRPERLIDNAALSGLAHPLRVRIFDELSAHGPVTSTSKQWMPSLVMSVGLGWGRHRK